MRPATCLKALTDGTVRLNRKRDTDAFSGACVLNEHAHFGCRAHETIMMIALSTDSGGELMKVLCHRGPHGNAADQCCPIWFRT